MSPLRQQFGMPDINQASLKILGDVLIIPSHPQEAISDLAVRLGASKPVRSLGLFTVIRSVLHIG